MIHSVRARVSIGGTDVPVESFDLKMGSYGSIGSFTITSSITRLRKLGLDIYATVSAGLPGNSSDSPTALADIYASTDDGKSWTHLMRGDIDNLRYNYDKMEVQLIGRDLGGRLYDSPVILKGSEEVNRTPLEIAQAFASDTGLSFVGPKTLPTMSTVGYKYLSNEAFKSLTPVRKWDFLVQLARNVGFQVYTTPKGELVFAPPDQTQQPIVYTWFADPHDTTLAPVKNLRVNYEPRRNKTFQVLILSYHPKTVSLESATTVILDQTIPFFKNKTVKEGFWHGAAGANIRSAFGQRLEGKPVYLFYVQGMTPQECEERADAMAKEISARQYTVEGSITSDLRLTPNVVVQLNGPIDNFKGQKLYVTGLTYRFGLHYGLQADFTALFVPPEPQAASVDPFG